MRCSQCSKPAVFNAPIGHLCLGCTHKYQSIIDNQLSNQERAINFLMDEIDMTFGLTPRGPRFPERKLPVIQNAPITMNNTILDRSIVGSVNTGYVHQLEVSMNNVTQVNSDGADRIKEFAEGVLKDEKLDKQQKEEIIQQLDFLVKQLSLKPEHRNKAVIKSILITISSIVNLSASLITLWEPVKALFGF